MDRTDWILLQKLYRERSMSKVAEQLYISQPAVAYRLKRIESEFGEPLFNRDTHGVRLTPAVIRLHSFFDRMLLLEEEISHTVRYRVANMKGRIHVGATSYFAQYFLSKQLKAFTDNFPNIVVSLNLMPSTRLYELYRQEKLSIAVVRGNEFDVPPEDCFTVSEENLVAIAPEPVTMDYMKTHPFIHNSVVTGLPVDEMINDWIHHTFDAPLIDSRVFISGDSRVMVQLVKNGFGWSVITSARLLETDGLFNIPIYKPNGEPYLFKTQLLHRPEENRDTPKGVYVSHFMDFFSRRL